MKNLTLLALSFLSAFKSFATAPITGPGNVCTSSSITLSDATPGGTWSSSTPGVATVSSSGIVYGLSAGTTIITYDVSGIYSTATITVNISPASISGPTSVCIGGTVTMSCATPGGTWYSSYVNISIGSVSGIVTGISSGSAAITYGIPSSGCSSLAYIAVSYPGVVSGSSNICVGGTTTLTGSGSGTWTSSIPTVAVVGYTTGVVTGLTGGTTQITYTPSSGCPGFITETVVTTPGTIVGPPNVCVGTSNSLYIPVGGGTWTSSATTIATVSAGMVTGISPGNVVITYTAAPGCSAIFNDTVISAVAPITGTPSVCIGSTILLYSLTGGGTWTSSSWSVAGVGTSSGVVTGMSGGTATITYSFGTGCESTYSVTVDGGIFGSNTVCVSGTVTLSSTGTGGTWTSSNPAVASIGLSSGILSGLTTGTTMITYVSTSGCTGTRSETVIASLPSITGPQNVCVGSSNMHYNAISGGAWSSLSPAVATVGPGSGIVSGISLGTTIISYTIGSCVTTLSDTVITAPAPVSGPTSVCPGATVTLADATGGGGWSTTSYTVAGVGSMTGVVTGISGGTAVITYSLGSGCDATYIVSVIPGNISAAQTALCGSTDTLTATGGSGYSWAPSTGLSCISCTVTAVNPIANAIYTVTGTATSGCTDTGIVYVTGNRIAGHIGFSGTPPSLTNARVWLIQYNASDSSVIATDSLLTCDMNGTPYYEFDNKPSGSYYVKAKMISSVPGTSDYIPTYGSSSSGWSSGTPFAHTTGTDSMHITMIYGLVPAGPGFIAGNVYFGAGRGTSGDAPLAGMLVFLKNASTGDILTYTYTDAAGGYSFTSLAYGDYIIYPEEYKYNTIPSSVITLSASNEHVSNISFKRHNAPLYYISPIDATVVINRNLSNQLSVSPNPATNNINIRWIDSKAGIQHVSVNDITGRSIYNESFLMTDASGNRNIDISGFANGIYILSVNSVDTRYKIMLTIDR